MQVNLCLETIQQFNIKECFCFIFFYKINLMIILLHLRIITLLLITVIGMHYNVLLIKKLYYEYTIFFF